MVHKHPIQKMYHTAIFASSGNEYLQVKRPISTCMAHQKYTLVSRLIVIIYKNLPDARSICPSARMSLTVFVNIFFIFIIHNNKSRAKLGIEWSQLNSDRISTYSIWLLAVFNMSTSTAHRIRSLMTESHLILSLCIMYCNYATTQTALQLDRTTWNFWQHTHVHWTASRDKTGRRKQVQSNSRQCLPHCQPVLLWTEQNCIKL